MRAVVLATGHCPAIEDFAQREPAVLLPVAARPFLHYVVEVLVDAGITHIDFVLSELPDVVEQSLGDGTRWGARFRYQLARDPEKPYGRMAVLGSADDEPVLVAHADRLPLWEIDTTQPRPELVFHNGEWTGWGVVPGSSLRQATEELDERAMLSRIDAASGMRHIDTDLMLSVRSPEDLLESNWAVLEKRFPKLMMGTREAGDRIWISRNVSLHPTAQITGPVYIGENCRINAGAQLGPRVVVGHNCLVDETSMLRQTVVFPGSYIGQGLELSEALVDRNRLANIRVGAAITVTDNFILGNFVENRIGHVIRSAVSRLAALALLVLLSPVLLLVWLGRVLAASGPAVRRKEAVRLPREDADSETYNLLTFCPSAEKHAVAGGAHEFFLHFLPGLINVARGHLSFVGVAPRGADEIERLPRDWKRLYLGSVGGLITESYVVNGPSADPDLVYTAEVFYTATAGPSHDLGLIAGYLARILGLKRRENALGSPSELEQ